MFFDRDNIIEEFQNKISIFETNKWQNTFHMALLGLRRTGKTSIIKHILQNYTKNLITVYFDISKISTTPTNFSTQIIFGIFSALKHKNYLEIDEIRIDMDNREIINKLIEYHNILKKGNNYQIINITFEIITTLSNFYKIIIALDEFQDLLDLKNFQDLQNIDAIFRSNLLNQNNIFYLISGSYPEIIKDQILNPKNKLYSHFEIFEIGNFDKKTSIEFTKYLNPELDKISIQNIFAATSGNPYLISILSAKTLNSDNFETIIKKELFNNKGQIYNHFLYILESSISKIGKTSTLNGILKEIAIYENMKIRDLADKLKISSQLVSKELQKIKKISILFQDSDKNIKFTDYLFRFFCYYYFSGYEIYESDKSVYYDNKILELENQLSKALSELGRTKEYELYYEIKEYQGKKWKNIQIPKFKFIKKNYFTETGDEIDLYCETVRGKKWIFELKFKNKLIGQKEIDNFINKIKADKYLFISKSGFVNSVLNRYANQKNILLILL